jgi:hypothetical protein
VASPLLQAGGDSIDALVADQVYRGSRAPAPATRRSSAQSTLLKTPDTLLFSLSLTDIQVCGRA